MNSDPTDSTVDGLLESGACLPSACLPSITPLGTRLLDIHLSDAQFSDLMAGEQPDPLVAAHLAACSYCRGEIDAVRAITYDVDTFTMASARQPAPRLVERPSRWMLSLGARPAWSVGFAAAAAAWLIAAALDHPWRVPNRRLSPVAIYGASAANPSAASVSAESSADSPAADSPSKAELQEDNQLLLSISEHLRYDAQNTLPASELNMARHARHRPALLVAY